MQTRESYDQASEYENNILADAAVGVVQWGASSLIDLGSTIWNSVVPEQYERSTYDNISAFSDDLATFYDDNKSAVELGSFVAGMIIPGLGVARAAKAASSGAGFFGKMGKMGSLGYSEAKIQHYTTKAADMAVKANADTAIMKGAIWKQRLWTVEKAVAENVLYEAAFYGLMNDHAYMDNYGVDTFLGGVALGTAITTPFSLAIASKNLKDAQSAAVLGLMHDAGLAKNTLKETSAVATADNPGSALAMSWHAEKYLTSAANAVDRTRMPDIHTFMRDTALRQEVQVQKVASSLLSPEAQTLSGSVKSKDDAMERWWELPKGTVTAPTPLKMIGHLTQDAPTALEGTVRGSVNMAKDYLNNIGTVHYADQTPLPRDDIGDLGNKPMTLDQAYAHLGGDSFVENDTLYHIYEWNNQVHMASAVHGRLLRRAGDEGHKLSSAYEFGPKAIQTYDPLKQTPAMADAEIIDAMHNIAKYLPGASTVHWTDLPRLQALAHTGEDVRVSIPTSSNPLSVQTAAAKDVHKMVKAAKGHWINELTVAGYDANHISIATNTPIDAVAAAQRAAGNPSAELALMRDSTIEWNVYRDASSEGIARALAPTMMTAKIDPTKQKAWAKGAAYDRDLITNATRVAVEQITQQSQSPMFRAIWESTAGKATSRMLEERLYQLYSAGRMGSIYTSTDMQLRHWEDLNATVLAMGKDFDTIVRKEGVDKIVGNLQPLMSRVASDGRAAIVNFEYLRNGLDAISGTEGVASHLAFDSKLGKVATYIDPKDFSNNVYLKIPGTNRDWVSEYDSVTSLVDSGILTAADDLWAMRTTNAALMNTNLAGRRGVYIPPNNPASEFVAYVMNKNDPKDLSQIIGKDKATLEQRIAELRPGLAADYEIVTRDLMATTWNKLHDYSAMNPMKNADSGMAKKGVPMHAVSGSPQVLDDLLASYQSEIYQQARIYNRAANGNIFANLDGLAQHYETLGRSAKGTDAQKVQMASSPATAVAKTLLNASRVGESYGMSVANNITDVSLSLARDHITNAVRGLTSETPKNKKKVKAAYDDFVAELTLKNIPNPFKNVHEYVQAGIPVGRQQSKEDVAAASQVMTTLNLRLADTAHAIVTTLSAPTLILTEAATVAQKSPMRYFSRVAKYFLNPNSNPTMDAARKVAQEKGYSTRVTSEVTDMMRNLTSEPGVLDRLAHLDTQKVKDVVKDFKKEPSLSTFADTAYKVLTKPSDFAEEITREYAYLVGYEISRDKSPLAALAVHEEAANLFTNRAMGNYAARQRSVLFQGTFGQAMGLYQTFMMTLGQNAVRHVETGNKKALSYFFGTYTPMFGIESTPFYDAINTFTGTWLDAPEHQDITQTVYEAFGNKYAGHERSVAEYLLYGAPSAMFQAAWYTRGDLDPRVPIDNGQIAPPILVGLADVYQTATAAAHNSYKLMQVGAPMTDVGRAMVEGIATQVMWRPAARLAELGLGYSIDRKGEIIANTEEVRNPFTAVMTRVSGARPLKEAVLRQQRFYNRAYDTVDTQRRRSYSRALRTHLATGDSSSGAIGGIMQGYLRAGGSPSGWNAVLNKTYMSSTTPLSKRLEDEVKQQEGMLGIIEGYGD